MYPNDCDPREIFKYDSEEIYNDDTAKRMLQVNVEWTIDDFENSRIPPRKFKHHCTLQDFEYGKVLGEGSFGKVYLVREHESKCVVALKVINKLAKEPTQFEVGGLQAKVTIQHYISTGEREKAPELYGYFHTQKHILLIVEYAPGGNLSQILEANELSERKIAHIMHQLCEIVQYTYQINIIHRDIKPENILLGASNEILLADYGISAYHNSSKPRNTFCGTPFYMAPETKTFPYEHTNAADIWSLGIVFHELFSGGKKEPSFDQKNNVVLANDIPGDAKDLMMQMLKIDPMERISAEDVLQHHFLLKNLK